MLVSIIIPIRNEEKFIGKCLDSFLPQIKGRDDFEILCVDGMSTDKTAEIIQKYAILDNRIRLIQNPEKIAPTAMNRAIDQAQGNFVMVVGSHAEYAANYIDSCLEVIQRTGAEHVGGYMTTVSGANTASGNAIAAATSCPFGIGNSMFRLAGPEQEADTVPFGMYRRDVFEKIGMYDERLVRNQDIELNSRLRKAGGKIIISPEIKLTYFNRATYSGLWQQAFNNGLWNPYTVWLVGGGLRLRHFIPMFFVLSLIVLGLLSIGYWPFAILLGLDISMYSMAAIYFAVKASKNKNASIIRVLISFFILHIAYGAGSLWGVLTIPIKFPNRKAKKPGTALADRKI